jgi:hypothetical protein
MVAQFVALTVRANEASAGCLNERTKTAQAGQSSENFAQRIPSFDEFDPEVLATEIICADAPTPSGSR